MVLANKKGRIRKCSRDDGCEDIGEGGASNSPELGQADHGTLVSIELENWMNIKGPTKYSFNGGINVITGLNGSGKSSVACGIAVSMGYDTHILARGHHLSSYIRNGSTSCRLVIIIKNRRDVENGYVSKIERVITMQKSNKTGQQPEIRSSWKLNGKKCLERDISALRRSLNIQLDNMVAFLAQQRVSQFASQSPQEIFIDTLRIISNGRLRSKSSANEGVEINIGQFESEFDERDLLGVYYKFLDIFKDSKECRLKLNDHETRLSQLSNEISKSKQNEMKYIQYLLNKMGIYLVHFYQSLNEIVKDRLDLSKLDELKKKVVRDLNGARKEVRVMESEFSKVSTELELAKKKSCDFLNKIKLEKLGRKYKSIERNLDELVNKLKENYRDPVILQERYRAKMRGIESKIADTENKIKYYKDQLESEWKPKLLSCKLYQEQQPQMFDMVVAEGKKRILGESVSEISSKTIVIQRRIKEFEFNMSNLIERKSMAQYCNYETKRERFLREKYLRRVNRVALSNNKRDNILGYFQKINEYSGLEEHLPKNKVIGPIGSCISLSDVKFQQLVETFLQQFHYYFVSEREDVKLLTERYHLNVLTLSNSKTPIYPKIDDELKSIGITGFLHEHLEFESEDMRNILYQISSQFFTCVIIDNPVVEEIQEDQILYKLSDWLKRKYDQPGNKVSNNVHLFVSGQGGEGYSSSKSGMLYKLVTSIYNPNSKTISMVSLGEKMNTILLKSELEKEEIPEMDGTDQRKTHIDSEIEQLELKIRDSSKNLEELKEQYNGEIKLLNIISECIQNVPPLYDKISKLEEHLVKLQNDLKENTPNENEIKLKNQSIIRSVFAGHESSGSLELSLSGTCIINELTKARKLLEEIPMNDFLENKELTKKVLELTTRHSSIQKEISKKNDEVRHFELRINLYNEDYDRINSNLELKRKSSIDSYLQYYSTYCQYHKRLKFRESSRGSNNHSDQEIYEFIYNKHENIHDRDPKNRNSEPYDDKNIKDVPGVELFSFIISGKRSSSNRISNIPPYCLEMIIQVSSEFGLLRCEGSQFEKVLANTLRSSSNARSSSSSESQNEQETDETDLTLFEVLLDNEEYKSKYNDLFNSISRLEARTHNTNLERMADLEQEFEILTRESQSLTNKMNQYEDYIGKHYKKWLERLEMIESVSSHCFGVFMRFVSGRNNGKIIIPFINNFQVFMNTAMGLTDKEIFNYFVDNFENDSRLNIMVRFSPDEDLRLFSSNSISGGEQSLCTILFILSLQGLSCESSVKLFDEINQGLDNSREVKLMELLDILTNKEKTRELLKSESEENRMGEVANYGNCQIIIITPHIFPGVIFENFSVHFVLNGPGFMVN
ncbi:Smc like ABC ATPase [Cryptosporidium canis]|uniref:Structural maintenance of chromosomes protein 5 n=1 Tax=Cryptosporidium canis TaxID=195482 RepID=A0ABQ8P6G7_9CRYT|nr:Smc like ABC ATPase [Cryptosporidium canis]